MLEKTKKRRSVMKYPYLYCDIDGTLADQSIISEENVAALKKIPSGGRQTGLGYRTGGADYRKLRQAA